MLLYKQCLLNGKYASPQLPKTSDLEKKNKKWCVIVPFMLQEYLLSEELVAACHPAAHLPCSISPVCCSCPELEIKGVNPTRQGLL